MRALDRKLFRDVAIGVDAVVNFAAESHVDRSLVEPDAFLRTDVFGVFTFSKAAFAYAEQTRCILSYERSFFRPVFE